jgi:hypothetical protein
LRLIPSRLHGNYWKAGALSGDFRAEADALIAVPIVYSTEAVSTAQSQATRECTVGDSIAQSADCVTAFV